MFDNVYTASKAKSEEVKAVDMVLYLYDYFIKNMEKIPQFILNNDGTDEQKVCDYISMMSDKYAVSVFENLTIPKNWTLL